MATYAELNDAAKSPALFERVKVACFIAAEMVRIEAANTANHDARVAWAKRVFENPDREARRMFWSVLAQNKDASLSAILAATDAQVQGAVNAAINVFA